MPTRDEHLKKAEHNESFVRFILREPTFLDWALNGAFYAAVHYVEAVIAKQRHHSFSHSNRGDGIRRYFPAAYKPYRRLLDLSMNARYLCVVLPPTDFQKQAGGHLETVKRLARAELGL